MLQEITSRHLRTRTDDNGRRLRYFVDWDHWPGGELGKFDPHRNRVLMNLRNSFVKEASRTGNDAALTLAAVQVLAQHAITAGEWETIFSLPMGPAAIGELAASTKLAK